MSQVDEREESFEERPDPLDEAAIEAVAAAAMEPGAVSPEPEDAGPVEPIVERCERLSLDVPTRLRLFQACCRMIHGEHQRGRILGDLTAPRLGLTADDEPAEIPPLPDLDPEALDACTSPEQVLGEPLTTAADVYALGAILYELLTGRAPVDVDPSDPSATAKAISEQAPERPSRAAPGDRRAAIGRDLDAIVLEALRKEPERRYASAAALADDLDASFAGLPVRAGRTSEWGRVARFIGRRKWVVGVSTAALLGMIGWGWWMIHRTRDLTDQLDRAGEAAAGTQRVMALMTDRLTDDEEPTDDDGELRHDLLTAAREHYERVLSANSGEAPEAKIDAADAKSRIAAIDLALDHKAEAAGGYLTAADMWRDLAYEHLGDPGPAFRLAEARAGLSRALDAGTKGSAAEAALAPLELARENYRVLADSQPSESLYRRRLARVLYDEADLQRRLGKTSAALAAARSAVSLLEELAWTRPRDVETRVAASAAFGRLARILGDRDDGLRGAYEALNRAVLLLDATPEPARESPRIAFETACRLIDLAELQRSAGGVQPAAATIARASLLLDGLLVKAPDDVRYRIEAATALNMEAEILRAQGLRDEATARLDRARPLLDRLVAEHPTERRYVVGLAVSRGVRGRMLIQAGKLPEALKSFQGAADLLDGLKDQDREAADAYSLACNLSLGLTLIGAKEGGKPIEDDADPSLTPADRARRKVYGRRAVAALRQAVAKGWNQPDLYRNDPVLDPLRRRDDFRKLMIELAASPEPAAKP
ncbi:protein kinase family protein [Paludisphaera rhizosphaerae]|uniref:hypothetical protein n=1 Tax=Paludisphaera rhizosphaerae TaxID=2711216 RepID=UPI0013EDC983|nr:hypothetical protein [Paludisphaera rhizosphaerae]